jgi:broad specificity phosphatase PhoE
VKLYLVRHGASTGNTPGNLIGQSDHLLSPLGEAQARAVAARLAPLGPMTVYASDLPRAMATAAHIVAAWTSKGGGHGGDAAHAAGVEPAAGRARSADDGKAVVEEAGSAADPVVIPEVRLREIHLGDLEGSSWEAFTDNQELTAAMESDPFHAPLPGGESLALVRDRVVAAVEDIVASTTEAACIVSHDGPIRSIVNHYLGVPPEKWWVVTTTHGGLSLLEFSDDWVDLRFLNDTAHLATVDYEL